MPHRVGHDPFAAVVFDLDGTLLDSDEALVEPFLALGIRREDIRFGPLAAEECTRLGIDLQQYLAAYDVHRAQPYDGVDHVLDLLDRWAVCSNKVASAGRAELARLGWQPEVALFADDFPTGKDLAPVIEALGVQPDEVVYVGDTAHDRACATAAGVSFAVALWNPRASAAPGDIGLTRPSDVLELVGCRL